MLKVLDLFSGIGGFSLGLERTGGFETVAFCEIEDFPRKVLAKHWPDVPCHKDVRKLNAEKVGAVDVITGGYPCQPFSLAGVRKGDQDDRHLWPEVLRLMATIRPRWGIFENVYGHVSMGLDQVLSDLEAEGYASQTFIVPACAVDAPHRRDRVWIVANTERPRGQGGTLHARDKLQTQTGRAADTSGARGEGRENVADTDLFPSTIRGDDQANAGEGEGGNSDAGGSRGNDFGQSGTGEDGINVAHAESGYARQSKKQPRDKAGKDSKEVRTRLRHKPSGCGEDVADTTRGQRKQREPQREKANVLGEESQRSGGEDPRRWLPEPGVGRVAHGIRSRVHRLKGLGNAVVPQIPERIGQAILEVELTFNHD